MKTVSNASLDGVTYDVAFDANAHQPSFWYGKTCADSCAPR